MYPITSLPSLTIPEDASTVRRWRVRSARSLTARIAHRSSGNELAELIVWMAIFTVGTSGNKRVRNFDRLLMLEAYLQWLTL